MECVDPFTQISHNFQFWTPGILYTSPAIHYVAYFCRSFPKGTTVIEKLFARIQLPIHCSPLTPVTFNFYANPHNYGLLSNFFFLLLSSLGVVFGPGAVDVAAYNICHHTSQLKEDPLSTGHFLYFCNYISCLYLFKIHLFVHFGRGNRECVCE